MSVEYLVNDTDLKKVADAIRAKGETTDLLAFPDGFVTAIQNITTAPKYDSIFANNDWKAIISACASGDVPDTWLVGDNKTMTINGTDYQIDIIGKDHDDYANGSGKAPLTFQLHDCYSQTTMHESTGNNNWKTMAMRTSTLPAILKKMPVEVQNAIREVTKITCIGQYSTQSETTADKLFILSDDEVGSNSNSISEGSAYSYYDISTRRVKMYNDAVSSWWLRSPATDSSHIGQSKYVNKDGSIAVFSPSLTSYGVSFGFCF